MQRRHSLLAGETAYGMSVQNPLDPPRTGGDRGILVDVFSIPFESKATATRDQIHVCESTVEVFRVEVFDGEVGANADMPRIKLECVAADTLILGVTGNILPALVEAGVGVIEPQCRFDRDLGVEVGLHKGVDGLADGGIAVRQSVSLNRHLVGADIEHFAAGTLCRRPGCGLGTGRRDGAVERLTFEGHLHDERAFALLIGLLRVGFAALAITGLLTFGGGAGGEEKERAEEQVTHGILQ